MKTPPVIVTRFLVIPVLTLLLFSPSAMAAPKAKHNRIMSIDKDAKTLVVTNKSLNNPITLRVDDMLTEILIDGEKGSFEDLKSGKQLVYVIGMNGVASRIILNPEQKSVFEHKKPKKRK